MKYCQIPIFTLCLLTGCISTMLSYAQDEKGKGKTVLQNGIVLPDTWPPQSEDPLSASPMRVPYLQNPPAVIPINTGRQLFVDDFLIEQTNLKRVFHQAKKYDRNPVFFPATKEELSSNFDNSANTYLGHGGVFFDQQPE